MIIDMIKATNVTLITTMLALYIKIALFPVTSCIANAPDLYGSFLCILSLADLVTYLSATSVSIMTMICKR